MQMTYRWALVVALLVASVPQTLAAATAVVEALQAPAWLSRSGRERVPLAAGMRLHGGDRIQTGVSSRAWLRLADGSRIKLGENATFGLERLAEERDAGRLLRATLNVLEGAFRFTTDIALRARHDRAIDVRFGTVTAGIRGTDIWGRNFGDREVVVLIEGKIRISRAADQPIDMEETGTLYQAPLAGPPSVEPIPAALLGEWAQQTEIQPGRGSQSMKGEWKLELARLDNQETALALYDSLRRDGYAARILPLEGSERQYSVRLTGLSSEAEAAALGERLKEAYPAASPKPMRR
jgi:hypothetical protein